MDYRVHYTPEDHTDEVLSEIESLLEKAKVATDFQEEKLLYDAANNLKKLLDLSEADITLYSSIIRLGDLEIVSSPGELGSALGIELKTRSRAKCCII